MKFYPLLLQSFASIITSGFGNIYYTTIQLILYKPDPPAFYFNRDFAENLREFESDHANGVHCSATLLSIVYNEYVIGLCVFAMSLERFVLVFWPSKFNKAAGFNIRIVCYSLLTLIVFALLISSTAVAASNHPDNCNLSFYANKTQKFYSDTVLFFLLPGVTSITFYLLLTVEPKDKNPPSACMIAMFTSCVLWVLLYCPKCVFHFLEVVVWEEPFANKSKLFYIWCFTMLHETFIILYAFVNPFVYFAIYPGFLSPLGSCWDNLWLKCLKTKSELHFQTTEQYMSDIAKLSTDVQLRMRRSRLSVWEWKIEFAYLLRSWKILDLGKIIMHDVARRSNKISSKILEDLQTPDANSFASLGCFRSHFVQHLQSSNTKHTSMQNNAIFHMYHTDSFYHTEFRQNRSGMLVKCFCGNEFL